jgi:MinD superfamily P-loop ATPase
MAAQVDYNKCTMCGGLTEPRCVEICPDQAVRVQDGRVVVTEFLCEDCNECGIACPDDRAIWVPMAAVTF